MTGPGTYEKFPLGKTTEVAEDVYAYIQEDGTWWLNNAGFVVGKRGVLDIDTCATEERTRHLIGEIEKASSAPVRTLVNTHSHPDHTFGNYLFKGAAIIGHENARPDVLDFGPPSSALYWGDHIEWGIIELEPPFISITDALTVYVDDLECRVMPVGGRAHSDNDLMVWIPERSVLFTGDLLFNGGTPFVVNGSPAGLIRVLEEIIEPLGAQVIVPGHGAVTDASLIAPTLDYLRFIQKVALEAAEAGLGPLEAARECDLGPYAGWLDSERIAANLHRALLEIGAGSATTVDVEAAMGDMCHYLGGGPLATHA